jgi:ABC-type amino acid transport substrate-binding protein
MVGGVSERLAMVASGKADLECANTSETLARLATVDFSNLIFVDGGGFLVTVDSTMNSLSDMGGKKIAVQKGTTTETRLRDALQRRLVNATVVPIGDAGEGAALLESGGVDAFAGDKIKLVGLAAQARDPKKLALLAEDLSFEPYALAIPRNDSAYRLEVNRALTQVYMSGQIEQIFAQWLGKLGRPSSLLAAMYLLNSIPD